MRLSTKGRYGIHAMYDLALYYGEAPQCIKAIADRENIPEAYLEQLIAILRKGGLVSSVRGAQGGYRLARPPKEITVGELLRTLEGGIRLVECVEEEDACGRSCICPSRLVWKKVSDGLNAIVDGITLQDMVDDYERITAQGEEQ